MKSKITKLVLSMIISIPFLGTCQINTYFEHNPKWKVHSTCGIPYPCIQNEDYNYFISGDTTINNLVYKHFYKVGTGNVNWFSTPPVDPNCSLGNYSYSPTSTNYFVRSNGKQVYLKELMDPTEHLLFDFDLAVGDSLPLTYNNALNNITVTAIDSFYTPYGYRKVFTLAGPTWSNFLIEGVGHSSGLFERIDVGFDCGFELNCYSLNDTSYYPSTGLNCIVPTSIPEVAPVRQISISPNPFSTFTEINFGYTAQNIKILVYDVFGKNVMESELFSGTQFKLQRKNLSQGMYLLKIKDEKTTIETSKLIVTD